MSDQKMHNGECYRACGCDPVAQARADERERIVAMLKERVLWEYNDSPKVAHALKYAAYLIESETTKP